MSLNGSEEEFVLIDKKCGSCRFAVMNEVSKMDITKRMCFGAPPTAIPMMAGPGKMTVQMCRPIVSVSDRACSLYEFNVIAQVNIEQDDVEEARQ